MTGFDPFILRAGTHRLNGDAALKYVRTRWEDPEGDFGRMERQQQFLTSIRDQILTPESIVKAPALVGRIIDMFESNLPVMKIPSLAKLSLQIPPNALKVANIDYTESRVYPAEGENGAKVLIPNVGLIQRYIAQVADEARQGRQRGTQSGIRTGRPAAARALTPAGSPKGPSGRLVVVSYNIRGGRDVNDRANLGPAAGPPEVAQPRRVGVAGGGPRLGAERLD